jgi:two-component system NtrC family sensor kinase
VRLPSLSVRAKLLTVVLLPLLGVLPLLIGLVFHWGNDAYDRLLIYKARAELGLAHQYLERVLQGRLFVLEGVAGSAELAAGRERPQALAPVLRRLAQRHGFEFLHLLDAGGTLLASSSAKPPGDRHAHWPVVGRAAAGRGDAALDVLAESELAQLDPALARRARVELGVPTDGPPDSRRIEDRGLLIHVAAPVVDAGGKIAAVVEAGLLLNSNLEFVDAINRIVHAEESLPPANRGTVTLFLDDASIATNVRPFAAGDAAREPALGWRAPLAVRDPVLGQGRLWLDRAFVVNDWYVAGFEPLHDSFGRRIAMLQTGFLEAPFADVRRDMLTSIVALFLVIGLAATVASLVFVQQVLRPLRRMDATISALDGGDAAARVGQVAGHDEVARLARRFDLLLDSLAGRSRELEQLNAGLDEKVAQRTAALEQANRELRAAQQQLVRSEKLAAVGQLTAGVAHEINNPIAVMQGNLDLLREILGARAAPVATEIRLLDQQIERMRLIVAKLLRLARPRDYAGVPDAAPAAADANAEIEDCLLLLRHEFAKTGVGVRKSLAATHRVGMPAGELQQVLINLIVNALHAMPQGGTLSLESQDLENGDVRIAVRDTGPRIAAEHLPRVFDPFFSTKTTQGTGLGLFVSHSLVEHSGGTLGVSSLPGQGAEFVLQLPAVRDEDG